MKDDLKYWKNEKANDDNFIVYDGASLFRRRASKGMFSKIIRDLDRGEISEKFIEVPISHISRIEYRENDPKIKIYYAKDSEERLKISNPALREEIFDYLKSNTEVKEANREKSSLFARIRNPLLLFLLLLAAFIYVYSFIDGLNKGYEYEFRGRPGIGAIMFALAHLGLATNLMIFIPLGGILLFRMYKKAQNNSEIHTLIYR